MGTSEYLPKNIFFEMFMKAQGYEMKSNILAEDNAPKFTYCAIIVDALFLYSFRTVASFNTALSHFVQYYSQQE